MRMKDECVVVDFSDWSATVSASFDAFDICSKEAGPMVVYGSWHFGIVVP